VAVFQAIAFFRYGATWIFLWIELVTHTQTLKLNFGLHRTLDCTAESAAVEVAVAVARWRWR
jgi:hypothetical protein